MSLTRAFKKMSDRTSVGVPSTRLYMKRSADTTKMTLLHKAGSRLFTQEVTDLKTREVTNITVSELPGSAARITNF